MYHSLILECRSFFQVGIDALTQISTVRAYSSGFGGIGAVKTTNGW